MTTYNVDFVQSEISFSVKLLNTFVKGTFDSYSPKLQCESLQGLQNAIIDIEIDAASLNTQEIIRDQHLRSKDFFDTDLYPKIYFHQKDIQQYDNNKYLITGPLTIKNITHEVTFDVTQQEADTPTFFCTTTVTRTQYNLTYNTLFEKMNQLGDEVKIDVLFTLSQT